MSTCKNCFSLNAINIVQFVKDYQIPDGYDGFNRTLMSLGEYWSIIDQPAVTNLSAGGRDSINEHIETFIDIIFIIRYQAFLSQPQLNKEIYVYHDESYYSIQNVQNLRNLETREFGRNYQRLACKRVQIENAGIDENVYIVNENNVILVNENNIPIVM